MGSFLAALGRAKPSESLGRTINTMVDVQSSQERAALNEKQMALTETRTQLADAQLTQLREETRQGNKPWDLEKVKGMLNSHPKTADAIEKMVSPLIETSDTGSRFIRQKNFEQALAIMSTPQNATAISAAEITNWQQEVDDLSVAMQKNEAGKAKREELGIGDKDAAEALQNAKARLVDARERDVVYQDEMKKQAEAEKRELDERRVAAKEMQARASMVRAERAGAPTPAKPLTRPQIDKRIEGLVKGVERLKRTGGADPDLMLMFSDQPEVLKRLTSGDVGSAVGELEYQIKYYRAQRDALDIPEPTYKYYEDKGLTRDEVKKFFIKEQMAKK